MRYIISYDLNDPGKNYPRISDELLRLGGTRVLYSQWVANRGETATVLRDHLKGFVDPNDRLLVVCLDSTDWAAWRLMAKISET